MRKPTKSREEVDKLPPAEREAYILSIQEPSTRMALSQTAEERAAALLKPIPSNYLAVPDAKSLDELVAIRQMSHEEALVYHRLRQKRGARIAEMRGEPDASSVDENKRSRAIGAFMFVRAKFKDLMIACGLASQKETVKSEK